MRLFTINPFKLNRYNALYEHLIYRFEKWQNYHEKAQIFAKNMAGINSMTRPHPTNPFCCVEVKIPTRINAELLQNIFETNRKAWLKKAEESRLAKNQYAWKKTINKATLKRYKILANLMNTIYSIGSWAFIILTIVVYCLSTHEQQPLAKPVKLEKKDTQIVNAQLFQTELKD